MMLPKHARLQLRQEKEFFNQAQRKNFPLFQIRYRQSNDTQFAVIVPKKICKSSAKRHKLVRQMRQILMQNRERLNGKQVAVVMFYHSVGKPFEELSQAVQEAAEQISKK